MSVQRFDVYLRPAGFGGAGTAPARTGTNADLATAYQRVVTADGFSGTARAGRAGQRRRAAPR